MRKLFKISNALLLTLLIVIAACDDLQDVKRPKPNSGVVEPTQLFILSEGLFNLNNSTLAQYNLKTQEVETDFFLKINKRGLGDTANDIAIYGSKIYVVVNVSSQIEILDLKTGVSLAQISMKNENDIAREPRYIDFHNGKAYVCSFDGTVAKIDTTSMLIEDYVQCGKNPDGICVANNKLYISNSGGLSFPDYDNTVSVIDLSTFTEIKKITVARNPGKIHSDSESDVYVITRGDYGATPYMLHKINSQTDELEESFADIQALNFTINNDTAYIYNYDFSTQTSWIKVFDCKTDKVIKDNFITDNTDIATPYGIDVNPFNGDVYITDAKNFTVWGDVYCFNRDGKLKFKINEIGLNPNKVVFASP